MKRFVLFLFIIIAGIFIFISTFNLNKYKPKIEKAVLKATGYEITIKNSISLSVFPFGIKVAGVAVENPSSFYKKDIVKIDRIYVGLNPFSIFSGNIKINSIELDNMRIYLFKNEKGLLNISNNSKGAQKIGKSGGKSFSVSKIVIKNAYAMYRNLKNGSKILMTNINIRSSLRYSGNAKTIYNSIVSKGRIGIGGIKINRIDLVKNLKASFDMDRGVLSIDPISYTFFGSNVSGSMGVDFAKNMKIKIKQTTKKLDLKELSKTLYKNIELSGHMFVNLSMAFYTLNPKKSLNGVFQADGKNIVMKGENLDELLGKYNKIKSVNMVDIGSFLVVGPLGILADKAYSVGSTAESLGKGKTTIRHLVTKIDIKNGLGKLSDVAFSTIKNRIAAKGILNFADSRYENVRVAVLNKKGCAKIVQKIEGNFSHPKVEVGSIVKSGIVGTIKSFFRKFEKTVGIKKTKCAVFYNGVVKQP